MKRINRILFLAFCVAVMNVALYAQPKAAGKTAAAQAGDPRVARALDQMKTKYEVDADGQYKVTFGVGQNRSHTAFIVSKSETAYGVEMRGVYTFAAFSKTPFAAELLTELLDSNMTNISAWAMLKLDSGDFALVNIVHIPAAADGKILDAAIQSVIVSADEMEERLTKKDEL